MGSKLINLITEFPPFQPQINGLPMKAKSKFDLNSEGRGSTFIAENSSDNSFPPRKAISTIALNHEHGWCPKTSYGCQSIKGNQLFSYELKHISINCTYNQ